MTEFTKICPNADELSTSDNHAVCPRCSSVFGSSSRLKMHLVRSHKIGEIEKNVGIRHFHCPEPSCKYSDRSDSRFFTKMKYLKQHYQKVHLERNFMCEKCKRYFVSEKLRMDHIQNECQVSFTCLSCSKSYSTKIALMTHCKRNNHLLPVIKPKVVQKNQNIVPKGQVSVQMEDIAAIALSELSWKVVVKKSVDASVQTDHRSCRRRRVKSNKKTQTQKGASSSTQTENPDLLDFPLNQFSSSTQTNDLMIDLNMLIDQHHNHTQTQELILDDDSPIILSDTHTQTMDLDDYSHNYTQTQDYFLQDFVELSDIETQTAWASLPLEDSALVSAQTQTLL